MGQPVCFDKAPFIREGSSTVRLQPGSAKEARLWERLQAGDFELKIAERDVELDELPSKLDIDAYFGLLGLRRPTALEDALPFLEEQDLIQTTMVDIPFESWRTAGCKSLSCRAWKRPIRVVSYAGKDVLDKTVMSFDVDTPSRLSRQTDTYSLLPQSGESTGLTGACARVSRTRGSRTFVNMVIHQDLSDTSPRW
ncbi:MAG: hypothetical protein ACLTKG_02495 [Collinsella intestinalis]